MLKVTLLSESSKAPTVAHPGEDVGYDVSTYYAEVLPKGKVVKIDLKIAVEATDDFGKPVALIVKDRSSMAAKGIFTHGGVIDAGYRGPVTILLSSPYRDALIDRGDKIAQLVPVPVLTGHVEVLTDVSDLSESLRGGKGFGSSGK